MKLDATRSEKRRWPRIADVRIDINPKAAPDIRADARRFPFRNGVFDEVYCDPPHNILLSTNRRWLSEHAGSMARPDYARYSGWSSRSDWFTFLDEVNEEFRRVLKPNGTLHFKCPDGSRSHGGSIRFVDLGRLTRFRLHEDHPRVQYGPFATMNRKMGNTVGPVHFATFEKI